MDDAAGEPSVTAHAAALDASACVGRMESGQAVYAIFSALHPDISFNTTSALRVEVISDETTEALATEHSGPWTSEALRADSLPQSETRSFDDGLCLSESPRR